MRSFHVRRWYGRRMHKWALFYLKVKCQKKMWNYSILPLQLPLNGTEVRLPWRHRLQMVKSTWREILYSVKNRSVQIIFYIWTQTIRLPLLKRKIISTAFLMVCNRLWLMLRCLTFRLHIVQMEMDSQSMISLRAKNVSWKWMNFRQRWNWFHDLKRNLEWHQHRKR